LKLADFGSAASDEELVTTGGGRCTDQLSRYAPPEARL